MIQRSIDVSSTMPLYWSRGMCDLRSLLARTLPPSFDLDIPQPLYPLTYKLTVCFLYANLASSLLCPHTARPVPPQLPPMPVKPQPPPSQKTLPLKPATFPTPTAPAIPLDHVAAVAPAATVPVDPLQDRAIRLHPPRTAMEVKVIPLASPANANNVPPDPAAIAQTAHARPE